MIETILFGYLIIAAIGILMSFMGMGIEYGIDELPKYLAVAVIWPVVFVFFVVKGFVDLTREYMPGVKSDV